MNVLFLGPRRENMVCFFKQQQDIVVCFDDPIEDIDEHILKNIDYVVCYGYRYILRESFLRRFPKRVINLHISFLPWNRGADPNLWSFLEDSPKGVSIHLIDVGLDTGPLLAQQFVVMDEATDTLRTSYEKLSRTIENLFQSIWGGIKKCQLEAIPQSVGGSVHRSKDKEQYLHLLTNGWDTPVKRVIGKAK